MSALTAVVCASSNGVGIAKGIIELLRGSPAAMRFSLDNQEPLSIDAAVNCSADMLILTTVGEDLAQLSGLLARRRCQPSTGVMIVIASTLTHNQISSVLSDGVCDFVLLPASLDELLVRAHRALGLISTVNIADVRAVAHPKVRELIGSSRVFTRQIEMLPVLAGCDAGVLILGETGTGKEIFAQAVHYMSARASRPWVAVNCGAIPADLVENELFGHAKGAFTTAHAAQTGLVCEAEGGTLFLDEIDSLPFQAQAKLLRFLQNKEYRPLGSSSQQRANVRIIAASNQQLEQSAAAGTFRKDLLFRLNVLKLSLPALRDRREDIPALASHFIQYFAREYGRNIFGLSPGALKYLVEQNWPGNVRELRHVIERSVLMAAGPTLMLGDVNQETPLIGEPGEVQSESFRKSKARVVEDFERDYIQRLLAVTEGNITLAAHAAKKNRRAFWELIRKHKIKPEQFRAHS